MYILNFDVLKARDNDNNGCIHVRFHDIFHILVDNYKPSVDQRIISISIYIIFSYIDFLKKNILILIYQRELFRFLGRNARNHKLKLNAFLKIRDLTRLNFF